MNVAKQMKRFIEPKSIALLGVSRYPEKNGHNINILEHLLSYGYQGRIYPVNPNATEILGVKTYPHIAEINNEVDLAVINLPRSLVPGIVKECTEQGIESIIIVTQGFAEASDEKGKQLQKQIEDFIRKNGSRVLGPNSLGTANAFINFSTSFIQLDMAKVPVGIICQSGSPFTFGLLGKGIDIGNACDVDFADSLEYFEQDNETKVVALHIEGIRDSKRFINAASRLTRRKPVVALKTGRSEHAAQAVQSHSGSLAGKDEIWETALRQSGIIRTSDVEELIDLTRAFYLLPPMKGRKIGIVSGSGGLGIITVDACYTFNLETAEFSPTTLKRINDLSPSWHHINNPADMWPPIGVSKQSLTKILTKALDAVLSDADVDAVCFTWYVPTPRISAALCRLLEELAEAHPQKPLVCCFMGPYAEETKNKLEATGRVAAFPTPERAIRALSYMTRYSAFHRGF